MDPKTFYGTKTFQKLEHALDEIGNEEYEHVESIDLCVLPPNLDELTDTEELDDDIMDDTNYIPKEIAGTIETSVISRQEPEEVRTSDQGTGLSKEYLSFEKPKWVKTDLPSSNATKNASFDEELRSVKEALRTLSPRQIF